MRRSGLYGYVVRMCRDGVGSLRRDAAHSLLLVLSPLRLLRLRAVNQDRIQDDFQDYIGIDLLTIRFDVFYR